MESILRKLIAEATNGEKPKGQRARIKTKIGRKILQRMLFPDPNQPLRRGLP
ncbi:MAG: hypothetical protein WC880_03805 [Candidatus Paceibacterota bacterium]